MPHQVHKTKHSYQSQPLRTTPMFRGKCWYCGACGHQRHQCPIKHRERNAYNRKCPPKAQHQPQSAKCHKCPPKARHQSAKCPRRKQPAPWKVHSPSTCTNSDGSSSCSYPCDCPYTKTNGPVRMCKHGVMQGCTKCRYPQKSKFHGPNLADILTKEPYGISYSPFVTPSGTVPCLAPKVPSSTESSSPTPSHCPEDWVNLPTQEELDQIRTPQFDQVMAFCTAMDDSFIHAALTAPHKLKEFMKNGTTFKVIWDSGASHCITNTLDDFAGPLRSTGLLKQLTGLAHGLHIKGVGTVKWTVLDINGIPRTLSIDAYYVPKSPMRLMSTAQLLQAYPGETIQLDDQSATLSGVKGDPNRAPVKAFVNPSNNIPDCTAFQLKELQKAALALHSMTVAVDPRNINLSETEKELLRWHQRLGHLDFKKIQFLL